MRKLFLLTLLCTILLISCSQDDSDSDKEILSNADSYVTELSDILTIKDTEIVDTKGIKSLNINFTKNTENLDKDSIYRVFDKTRTSFNGHFNIFNKLDYINFNIYDKNEKENFTINFEKSGKNFLIVNFEEHSLKN